MAVDREALEQQYREILAKAAEQQPGHTFPQPAVTPIENFFFPWEYSPYRANGSTSAEGNRNDRKQ